jgi:hypothetical protein
MIVELVFPRRPLVTAVVSFIVTISKSLVNTSPPTFETGSLRNLRNCLLRISTIVEVVVDESVVIANARRFADKVGG